MVASGTRPFVRPREAVTLACAGVAISVSQFLLIREFTSLLYGEELVIVTVTACCFAAMSLGYAWAARAALARLRGALALATLAQLAFPTMTRVAAAPTPCRKRSASRIVKVGEKAAPNAQAR